MVGIVLCSVPNPLFFTLHTLWGLDDLMCSDTLSAHCVMMTPDLYILLSPPFKLGTSLSISSYISPP